jgi:hypothetical protein
VDPNQADPTRAIPTRAIPTRETVEASLWVAPAPNQAAQSAQAEALATRPAGGRATTLVAGPPNPEGPPNPDGPGPGLVGGPTSAAAGAAPSGALSNLAGEPARVATSLLGTGRWCSRAAPEGSRSRLASAWLASASLASAWAASAGIGGGHA